MRRVVMKVKSRWRDLNPRPADYESAAIPLSHNGTENVLYQIVRTMINKLSASPPGEALRHAGYE